MAYVDGAVDKPPTIEQNPAGHSDGDLPDGLQNTLLAERRAEAQIGEYQTLQRDGLRCAPFRHVAAMDAQISE